MKKKIAIIGAGSWGTALAKVLEENGHRPVLYSNVEDQIKEINEEHTNKMFLPNLVLSENIKATTNLKEALTNAQIVLFVLPTKVTRIVARQVSELLEDKVVLVTASKGLEQQTHKRISEILQEEISEEKREGIVALSGPSHAEEVAVNDLTTITAASENLDAAEKIQEIFMNNYMRIYTNKDIIGVEYGAALKNIIALGAGALAGLGYGDNAKAALITRGLAEISRLGIAFGADPLTFIGLSGVGDLIVTCTSIHSRNWQAGNMIGKGHSLDEVLETVGMVVEGASTVVAARELAKEKNIELPITEAIYSVLYEHADVKNTIIELMNRDPKAEAHSKDRK